jgi:hypothetical protein
VGLTLVLQISKRVIFMLNHFFQIQEPLDISQKLISILFPKIENFINIYPIYFLS